MEKYQQFQDLVAAMQVDFDKFYNKGVAAAGTRVRKYCQDLTVLCKETRKDVAEIRNARKEAKV